MPSRRTSGKEAGRPATVGVVIYSRQYRSAVVSSLEGREGITPVDLGDGGEESLRRLHEVRPRVLLVDLPGDPFEDLLRTVHALDPSLTLLAVNCEEAESRILALFEAGLTGFVPHDSGPDDLVQAIRDALAGEFHCPPRVAAALVRRVNAAGDAGEVMRTPAKLTPREAQVARLLERALTNKEIASRLAIEVATVRNHVYSICRKLDAHRRTEVVARMVPPRLRVVPGARRRGRGR